ncbi:MAG: mitochondrial 54S ribosomal protein YmL19 [Paramarteilia canceri]
MFIVLSFLIFTLGSILAVTTYCSESDSKTMRFVGICIFRRGTLLRHSFCLRNHVHGESYEIEYHLYSPKILKIEVLKLEKRLDSDLNYLRDCDPKYSTFPEDMQPVPHPKGMAVPINTTQIEIGPKPWQSRWNLKNYKGLKPIDMEIIDYRRMRLVEKNWEQFDLIKFLRSQESAEILQNKLRFVQQNLENTRE